MADSSNGRDQVACSSWSDGGLTGGKGSYTMQLHAYDPVPSHMQDKLVQEIQRLQEEED